MELIGHKTQWQFLRKSVEWSKLPHALLFYGPSRIGKKTLALELTKLLNCQEKDFQKRPCQHCFVCQSIEKQVLPDLILLSPQKKEISIEAIREVNWKMSLKPYSAPWKVAILDSAHSLGKAAQNCFLKTLEEPKDKGVFILITEYPFKLLPTILSRTQKVRFSPVSFLEIENYLKKKGVSFEKIKKIITFSYGRVGVVLEFLKNEDKLRSVERKIQELEKFIHQDINSKFEYAKELSEKPLSELNQIFEIWLFYFRRILFTMTKPGSSFSDNLKEILKLKKNLENIEKTQILLNFTNINKKLALENLMLQF